VSAAPLSPGWPDKPDPLHPVPRASGGRGLARRLMVRASAMALLTLVLVALVGAWTAQRDIEDEMRAALSLARTLQHVSVAQDGAALAERLVNSPDHPTSLRHLQLGLRDAEGRVIRHWRAETDSGSWIATAARWQSRWWGEPELPAIVWTVPQRSGEPWTLTLTADAESERREALADLSRVLLLLALGTLLLLGVLGWSVQRSLQPLQEVARTLARIRPGHTAAARELREVHLREVDQVTVAVRTLAEALDRTESERRILAQKLQSMLEAERSKLARELHDEWGQRLTGLRLDASWLQRRLQAEPELAQACERMGQQCARLQADLSQRLQSLAPRELGAGQAQALHEALQDLVAGWSAAPGSLGRDALQVALDWQELRTPPGPAQDLPAVDGELLLAVYRLSQEGLTNVARHAHASQARLAVHITNDCLLWTLTDDGRGIGDADQALRRGTGLASLRERAWSHGTELLLSEAIRGTPRPGLKLSVTFDLRALPERPHTG
jgi:two-component system, NarL family, sensor histidine kinase UhpB